VQSLYSARSLDQIATYCMTDVLQTWLTYLRGRRTEGSLAPDGYDESVASVREQLPALFARRLPPRSVRSSTRSSRAAARSSARPSGGRGTSCDGALPHSSPALERALT